mmetsp:Transcript_2276/g.5090  ORF Transcript_2276/g.5090 Transcript_2276/m.5090 type:complete len:261 (+) Transcript_2276:118-900(+)
MRATTCRLNQQESMFPAWPSVGPGLTCGTNSSASARRFPLRPKPAGAALASAGSEPCSTVIFRRCLVRHSTHIESVSSAPLILMMRSPALISRVSPAHCRFQASTAPPGMTLLTTRQVPLASPPTSRPRGTCSARLKVRVKVGAEALGLTGATRSEPVPPEEAEAAAAAAAAAAGKPGTDGNCGGGDEGDSSSSSTAAATAPGRGEVAGVWKSSGSIRPVALAGFADDPTAVWAAEGLGAAAGAAGVGIGKKGDRVCGGM